MDPRQEKSRPIEDDVGIQEHRYKIYTSKTCLYHGRTERTTTTTTCWHGRTVVAAAAAVVVGCYTPQPCNVGIAAVLLPVTEYYHVEMMVLSCARDLRVFVVGLLVLRDGSVPVCELSVTIAVGSIVPVPVRVRVLIVVIVVVVVDDIDDDAPVVAAACSTDDDSRVALVVVAPPPTPLLLFCWGIELHV